MLALNKTTGYAIQALASLDEPGGKPKFIEVIAAETMVPQPYLRKVIRKLSALGFIHTRQGLKGGAILAKLKKEITLFDIAEATGSFGPELDQLLPPGEGGILHASLWEEHWAGLREELVRHLRSVTLADITQEKNAGESESRDASGVSPC
ncbi:MAG: Rrf2 family transcriptional regulator [Holophagaceae bacterium]|nr:Rrf2 family transcriptional regulator [Holophagaceae bacterium]